MTNLNFIEPYFASEALKIHKSHVASLGFDVLRLPGGTSPFGEICVRVVIYDYNEKTKRIDVCLLPYKSKDYKSEKKSKNKNPIVETPQETAVREIWEETGLIIDMNHLVEIKSLRRFYSGKTITLRGAKEPVYFKDHTKYYYVINRIHCKNHLAEFPETGNPGDKETGDPFWAPFKDAMLPEVIFKNDYPVLDSSKDIIFAAGAKYAMAML